MKLEQRPWVQAGETSIRCWQASLVTAGVAAGAQAVLVEELCQKKKKDTGRNWSLRGSRRTMSQGWHGEMVEHSL